MFFCFFDKGFCSLFCLGCRLWNIPLTIYCLFEIWFLFLIIKALLAAGVKNTKCTQTLRWLKSRQNPDGSFINLLSTIYVIPTLIGALPYDLQDIRCPNNTTGKPQCTFPSETRTDWDETRLFLVSPQPLLSRPSLVSPFLRSPSDPHPIGKAGTTVIGFLFKTYLKKTEMLIIVKLNGLRALLSLVETVVSHLKTWKCEDPVSFLVWAFPSLMTRDLSYTWSFELELASKRLLSFR